MRMTTPQCRVSRGRGTVVASRALACIGGSMSISRTKPASRNVTGATYSIGVARMVQCVVRVVRLHHEGIAVGTNRGLV
jgi:hypothetical protein